MRLFIPSLLILCLSTCAGNYSPEVRRQLATDLISHSSWTTQDIKGGAFYLRAYSSPRIETKSPLYIYIEGDGLAWFTRSDPSLDPTPSTMLVLELALKHQFINPQLNVAYLARPCQYIDDAHSTICNQRYWTNARFSPEVIISVSDAIDQLKKQFQSPKVILIGYSGGGAIAALVAARRDDVDKLVTIAGNLDHVTWARLNHISPLDLSLNPVDYSKKLSTLKQLHLIGTKDDIVPKAVTDSYVSTLSNNSPVEIRGIPDYTHTCCWLSDWPELME